MIFTNYRYKRNPVTGYNTLSNVGEWSHHNGAKRDPIFSFSFKIAKDALEGDHTIFLNLTYKSLKSDKWYTDKQAINIHVERWYEREEIRILAIFAAIATIISALILLLPFLSRIFDP